ncbi:MAG: Gfo/Idh/MocA family oxidoreductase [Candidatus Sumerlaeota bacterium]|nr:Gfo/Idh/MocA family oxidoreductase [Candidatus Sumerlaeota bacterium]
MSNSRVSRRRFVQSAAAAAGVFMIVPRHVLGGSGFAPPSETITRGVVGTGGRGMSHVEANAPGKPPVTLAVCDVDKKRLANAVKKAGGSCEGYADFRRLLDRKDMDTIHIGTPPHWHSLVTIAAAETGRDILCEKPMTRFIAEGQAVIEAVRRNGRVFQIGTFGRFGRENWRKLILSGRLGMPLTIRVGPQTGFNWKVKMWSGHVNDAPKPVPEELDYDLWLGPAPFKPYFPHRVHGSFRGYWDYDGGGLADMGEHYLDPIQYWLGKDEESPVEIEADAPPAHPDACGLWGEVRMKYADGTTLILDSGEWGKPPQAGQPLLEGPKGKVWGEGASKTDPAGLFSGLDSVPAPPKLISFPEAVRSRQRCGGNEESSHRSASLMHLANAAIRTGRKLQFDSKTCRFVNDEEANRLADVPMRAPWRLQ